MVSSSFIFHPSSYLLKSSDFSDQSETAADYFSRSNRRGSIVSDADDVQGLNSVSAIQCLLLCYAVVNTANLLTVDFLFAP